MIKSFKDKEAEKLWKDAIVHKRFLAFDDQLYKRLLRLDSACTLDDLRNLPHNNFEALRGKLNGCFSIRINLQYWIVFKWDDAPYDVEVTDYH